MIKAEGSFVALSLPFLIPTNQSKKPRWNAARFFIPHSWSERLREAKRVSLELGDAEAAKGARGGLRRRATAAALVCPPRLFSRQAGKQSANQRCRPGGRAANAKEPLKQRTRV